MSARHTPGSRRTPIRPDRFPTIDALFTLFTYVALYAVSVAIAAVVLSTTAPATHPAAVAETATLADAGAVTVYGP